MSLCFFVYKRLISLFYLAILLILFKFVTESWDKNQ